jgi:hypothetical protein
MMCERTEDGMRYTGPGDLAQYYRWAFDGDCGISSKTIVQALTGAEVLGSWHPGPPLDSDDFGRCMRALDRFPWLRAELHRLPELHKSWPSALNDEWERLEFLCRNGDSAQLTAILRRILSQPRSLP